MPIGILSFRLKQTLKNVSFLLYVQALEWWALPQKSIVLIGFWPIGWFVLYISNISGCYVSCIFVFCMWNIGHEGLVGDFSALYFLAQFLTLVMGEKKFGSPPPFPLDVLHIYQTHLKVWVHRVKFTQKQNRA